MHPAPRVAWRSVLPLIFGREKSRRDVGSIANHGLEWARRLLSRADGLLAAISSRVPRLTLALQRNSKVISKPACFSQWIQSIEFSLANQEFGGPRGTQVYCVLLLSPTVSRTLGPLVDSLRRDQPTRVFGSSSSTMRRTTLTC